MRKTVISILLSGLLLNTVYAETIEERLERLEKKVEYLEKKVEMLERKSGDEEVKQRQSSLSNKSVSSKSEKSVKPPSPVDFKVLDKRFRYADFKSTVWNNKDKIIFKVDFRYKLSKPASVIVGDFIVKDKSGNILYKKPIKIHKAFNIFKGTKIKPGEVVRMNVEIPYDKDDKNLVKLRKLSLNQLDFEFKPIQVVFTDDSVLFYKKAW